MKKRLDSFSGEGNSVRQHCLLSLVRVCKNVFLVSCGSTILLAFILLNVEQAYGGQGSQQSSDGASSSQEAPNNSSPPHNAEEKALHGEAGSLHIDWPLFWATASLAIATIMLWYATHKLVQTTKEHVKQMSGVLIL